MVRRAAAIVCALLLAAGSVSAQEADTAAAKPPAKRPLAIAVKQLIPVAGDEQPGAILLVDDGVITKTGRIAVPKEAAKVSLVSAWAMPGLVDAVTRAGAERDLWESAAAYMPELRAADALDPWSREVRALGRAGITAFGLTPRPQNVAAGFAAACRSAAAPSDAAPAAAIARTEAIAVFSLTRAALRTSRFPGSRMGAIPALRQGLAAGRDGSAPMLPVGELGRDAAHVRAAFGRVVRAGRALIHAETSDEIDAALSLGDLFPNGLTICFPTEAHRRVRELGAAQVRVVLRPPLPGAAERELSLAAKLHAAGAAVVFATDTPTGRPDRLLLGASLAHAAGLPREAALRAITSEPAALLGIEGESGTAATGMRADLCFFSGDPLSGSARLIGVMAGGEWLLKPPGVK